MVEVWLESGLDYVRLDSGQGQGQGLSRDG